MKMYEKRWVDCDPAPAILRGCEPEVSDNVNVQQGLVKTEGQAENPAKPVKISLFKKDAKVEQRVVERLSRKKVDFTE